MKWEAHITGLDIALLAIAIVLPSLSLAQKNVPRAAPARPVPMPQQHVSRPQTPLPSRPQGVAPRQQGHAGDWLRQHKDLPPEEQERALQNDPNFHRLSPQQQQHRLQQLREFSSLPPAQQLRILNRMETWEHLTPQQKQEARQVFSQMRQLPPDRRRLVHKAIDDLRGMPPDQREQIINSDRFKGMFSDHERDVMRDATRLPLAPADSGDQPGTQE
ncbi:MAG TPA: DUF3106 domain-containing protein [Candidatus Sulfotelmatobacter sp.]|nr:DUF3106 domain-containing protein [Candidatus Sulfotelmatobacter sp.]